MSAQPLTCAAQQQPDRDLTPAYVAAVAQRIASQVVETPTLYHEGLSKLTGAKVYLKYENAQRTGAFKARGAAAKLMSLSQSETRAGIIAMSAGNHAQGVACFSQALEIPATIVMPRTTSFTKIRKVRSFGATVVLEGENFSEASQVAHKLAREEGLTVIHPYDDRDVIAGQGTVALEMLRQAPEIDSMVVPVGGGGLIAGCSLVAADARRPVRVFGVQSAVYPGMAHVLAGLTPPTGGLTIAEGIAVQEPGLLTRAILKSLGCKVLTVKERTIEQAMAVLATTAMTVVEGAAAAPLAALFEHRELFEGQRVGLVVSGGNIDARLLSSILMRHLVHVGEVTTLTVEMNDNPGQLHTVSGICARYGANVLEVAHKRFGIDLSVRKARLAITFETREAQHSQLIVRDLRNAGYAVDLSDVND